ncbi:hypothetical protein H3146_19470 [Streptomyces sp. OF3]|uniref:Uncharacterized protein n=1 Tax=Streptomyces alkaliterrae TaxID=2213162 RepID=A0A7W3WNF5_9ACTN|nr:hypothetical protein [Streptomyces alkaliterrae]MBB1255516.1 hypothetical protein [Streptomyces alkaliterrae]
MAASLALCLTAGLLGGWWASERAQGHHLTFTDTAPDVVPTGELERDWPSRGDLLDDDALLRAAMRAHAVQHGDSKEFDARARSNQLAAPQPTVLFAGTLGAAKVPTVLLLDNYRNRIFQYEERDGEGRRRTQQLPSRATYQGAFPLLLNPSADTPRNARETWPRKDLRLVLPRDLSNPRVAGFNGKRPAWRPVTVKDGVTEPLRSHDAGFSPPGNGWRSGTLSKCDQSGLLLRATMSLGQKRATEMYYLVREGDFHAIQLYFDLTRQPDEPLDAQHARTLARSLLCAGAPVNRGEQLAEIYWKPLWRGTSPDSRGRKEIASVLTATLDGETRTGLVLVGVDEPRHIDYFVKPAFPREANREKFDLWTACAVWDGQLVATGEFITGEKDSTRIQVTNLSTGKNITKKGTTLTVPLAELGGATENSLLATFTGKSRTKGKTRGLTKRIHCYRADNTPTF